MYGRYFGLKHLPFSIAPDPRYLFMSERHREALAHLLYGVRGGGGGFVVLTGDIGAGKTTVCRCLLEQLPARCNVGYIFNPKLTVDELLRAVCGEFRIPEPPHGPGGATVKDWVDALNEFLLRTHAVSQNNVLIIDEAQNLSPDVLEQLRLLTNLETNERKLLQIVLIGQPELRALLARPEMQQLAQRVIARYHLEALSEAETVQYVRHRLTVAGLSRAVPFDGNALRRIFRHSRGVPRRINLLCDRALLGAYAKGKTSVDARIIDDAAHEVFDQGVPAPSAPTRFERPALIGIGVVAGVCLVGGLTFALGRGSAGPASIEAGGGASAATAAGAPSGAVPGASGAAAGAAAGTPAPSPGAGASPGAPATAVAGRVTPAPPAGGATSATGPATGPATAGLPPAGSAGTGTTAPAGAAKSGAVAADAIPFDLRRGFGSLVGAERDAWRDLARGWDVPVDGDPCVAGPKQDVWCFRAADTTLALIRQLNRPGILTLRDAGNRVAYAVLAGLNSESATLRIRGEPRTVPLWALADYWRGEYATLWKVPPEYAGAVIDSRSGRSARWLALQLATARGDTNPVMARFDDAALRGWIRSFQLTQGLPSDGVAGPVTLMHLNRVVGIDEPHLLAEK